MDAIQIETRREAADRLAIAESLKRETDHKTRCVQALTADAILRHSTVEHVTCWTDTHGRPKHSSRVEIVS